MNIKIKNNDSEKSILKNFTNYFLIYLLFIFIFGPVLNKFGAWIDFIFIFSIIIFILNLKYIKQINKPPLYYFFILIIFYFLVSIKILTYPELTLLTWMLNFIKPFRIILTLFSGYFLARILFQKNYTFLDIIKYIYYAIIIHGIVILIQFINVDFRDFIYSYTTTGEFRSTFEYEFRMGGFTGGSGGAVLSVVQSLGIILLPFILKYNLTLLTRFSIYFGSFVILTSIILTGRSGIYCILIFLPFSIYQAYGTYKTIKYTFYTFSACIILFIFINQLLLSLELTDFYNSFYRTFDSFISFSETGKYENETVSILKDYILIPDIETLLFGSNDALLNHDVDRNLDSDIGYIRNIFSFGIFGFAVYALPFIMLLIYTYKKIKSSIPHKLLFILLIIMLFFHSKESFLYVRMFWSIISLIVGYVLVEENHNKRKLLCAV